ncbi:RNA polymerase sigma factor RpoE [Stieleria neptunia]|uniref:RNA polymerase sigma factor RpoE n=1 Tax=Stieleria neptunia TaxID=2527979 RepID=A0A518I2X1_9BACT|nr:sigma-70 family RNA polymerase sigma factor [Stieleria neptunia]QDV47460.1 RNA polymerase sigma factor RpoE [Stieleria neptunia]
MQEDSLTTPHHQSAFQSTHWSVVLRAGVDGGEDARSALGELCQTYWYPIYAFVRRRGNDHHDAVDLTQGFFTQLMEKQSLHHADPQNGRFRAFLLASVKNFMTNDWRARGAVRRGGNTTTVSVDNDAFRQQYQQQLADDCTPEMLFERSWIDTLLRSGIERLRREYAQAGKSVLFEAIHPHLVASSEKVPQADIADQLEMTKAAVAMSIHRLRQRYAHVIREAIASTVADPEDIEDELSRLLAVFAAT